MPQARPEPVDTGDPRWRALMEDGPFYVATFGADGRITSLHGANAPRPAHEYLGRRMAELGPPGGRPDLAAAIDRVLETGKPERIEIPARVGEQTLTLDVRLLPIREAGATTGVVAVGLDVTEDARTALELRMSVNALRRAIESREQLEADLHDGILQSLYGVGLRLEAARATLAGSPEASETHVSRAIEQIKATMSEIRRYIEDGPARMPAAVHWDEALIGVLRGLEVEGGPSLVLELDREAVARVPGPVQSEVTFVAREAVSNAVRHAAASRVMVRLLDDGPGVRLEVEDNGRGFPPEPRREGFGLVTMARRAAQIGATLSFQSVPDRGTLIRLDLPVSHDRSARR